MPHVKNTVERFSDRVGNYSKFRPGYPAAVLDLFKLKMGLTPLSVVADIGSGPGMSSKLFLEKGCTVYGVEPNPGMRMAAELLFKDYEGFKSIPATAENTSLPPASVDFVVAAQAFHWFEEARTRKEFHRILRPGGHIVLIWNERQLDTTPFLQDYEAFLLTFGNDYTAVRHENITAASLQEFFQSDFRSEKFPNVQVLDFDGLKGRMLSSSYMPSETEPVFEKMVSRLRDVFDKHAEQGKIEILYDTNVYFTKVDL